MKRTWSVFFIFLLAAIAACNKKDAAMPEVIATKFSVPTWQADDTGKYPATMTAVVALPASLAAGITQGDQLAAFVNHECRGVGVMVNVENRSLFFVLIQGLPEESNNIVFRYYGNTTAYMYESQSPLTFLADAVYGTAENPKTLDLVQLK